MLAANVLVTNAVAMIHAILESGRTSRANRWQLFSVVAQPLHLVTCYKIVLRMYANVNEGYIESSPRKGRLSSIAKCAVNGLQVRPLPFATFIITFAGLCSCRLSQGN